MSVLPFVLDNAAEDAKVLAGLREVLRQEAVGGRKLLLQILTGYVDLKGLEAIHDLLDEFPECLIRVELLIGAEPIVRVGGGRRVIGETEQQRSSRERREQQEAQEQRMSTIRDRAPFTKEFQRQIEKLKAWEMGGAPRLVVRRYMKQFLHGKAYIFSYQNPERAGLLSEATALSPFVGASVFVGSSNCTGAGLSVNRELNLVSTEKANISAVRQWFEAHWAEAELYTLAAFYEERWGAYTPYQIFLAMLRARYGQDVELGGRSNTLVLTDFQQDGVERAERILDEHHGVLVADAVGLGKSYVALELLRRAVLERRQRAVVVAPAVLRDGVWADLMKQVHFQFECVSYDELINSSRINPETGKHPVLAHDLSEYALVVADEAHAVRNPATGRAQALRTLLQGSPPKDLVLLTATPVNNSLWDLYHALGLFLRQDAALASVGIPSMRQVFKRASERDPEQLEPELLFDVLDQTTVRRTRSFVKKYYPNAKIASRAGQDVVIRFPRPIVRKETYSFELAAPGMLAALEDLLMPDPKSGATKLKLARYQMGRYTQKGNLSSQEASLSGFVRTMLLKRLESSWHAFEKTLERMIQGHRRFLEGLNKGVVLSGKDIEQLGGEEEAAALQDRFADLEEGDELEKIPPGVDVRKWKADIEKDLVLLVEVADSLKCRPSQDPKLELLVRILKRVLLETASEPDEQRRKDRRKVLCFSYFGETVDWITERLSERIQADPDLAWYRGSVASVVSDTSSPVGVNRDEVLRRFAPRTVSPSYSSEGDEFHLLIATDVLSEGVNLQQAGRIVNLDLPWNPMRLVQRHGRIDRIGSPHETVEMTCIVPDKGLDEMLRLMETIERKTLQAAKSIGLEHNPIGGGEEGEEHVFAETRKAVQLIQNEDEAVLEMFSGAQSYSGEEYRRVLAIGLTSDVGKSVKRLPLGAGAGRRTHAAAGTVFCVRVGERVFYLFAPDEPGKPIIRDTLPVLSMVSSEREEPSFMPEGSIDLVYQAWPVVRDDLVAVWNKATDPAAREQSVPRYFREVERIARKHVPPTWSAQDLGRFSKTILAPHTMQTVAACRRACGLSSLSADPVSGLERLRQEIYRLSLEPYEPPSIPKISSDDIELVAWMRLNRDPD